MCYGSHHARLPCPAVPTAAEGRSWPAAPRFDHLLGFLEAAFAGQWPTLGGRTAPPVMPVHVQKVQPCSWHEVLCDANMTIAHIALRRHTAHTHMKAAGRLQQNWWAANLKLGAVNARSPTGKQHSCCSSHHKTNEDEDGDGKPDGSAPEQGVTGATVLHIAKHNSHEQSSIGSVDRGSA